MYQKILWFFISLFLSLGCASISMAIPFFNFGNKTTQNTPPPSQASPVMNAEQFKSTVSKMGQQTKSTITNQVSQQFLKQPPLPAELPPVQQPTGQPTGTEALTPPVNNPTQTTVTMPPPTTTTPPTVTAPPIQSTVPTVSPYAPQPVTQPPAQNQPYTGFGTGTQNNTGNPPNTTTTPANGGSWNIKY